MQGLMPRVSELSKLLVSQDISQHNTLDIFRCKKEYFFRNQYAEFHGSSRIKNITDKMSNLNES